MNEYSWSPQETNADNLLNETNSSDISDVESDIADFAFLNFATDSSGVENSEKLGATDSGDVPFVMDSNEDSIPTHFIEL